MAKLVRPEKAGHAGTLDPLATGVLVVCVGKATRLIEAVQEQPKSYHATFLLGRQSDTDDITGTVSEVAVGHEIFPSGDLEHQLPAFVGRIEQVPPTFSAGHVAGRRAHERARAGQTVELTPRLVEVFRLAITRFAHPELELDLDCGSGTYVRSIGRDLGQALGCGAVMSALVRTRVGPYRLENAVTLEQLTHDTLGTSLLNPATALAEMPRRVATTDEEIALLRAGRAIPLGDVTSTGDLGLGRRPRRSRGSASTSLGLDRDTCSLRPYRVFLD